MTHITEFGDPNWLAASDIGFSYPIGEQIREIIKAYEGIGFVAGGAARFVLIPDAPHPSDIDIWMYHSLLDPNPLYELGYHELEEVTGTRRFRRHDTDLPVQIILPHSLRSTKSWGTPLEVMLTFTFTTEQFAVMHGAGGASGLLSVAAKADTENRVIMNNNCTKNPILSLHRLNKYGRKGYQVSMETLLEITTVLHRMSTEEYAEAISIATSVQS